MAETLAIIGLVSSIVQFVDFGTEITRRLNEFQSNIQEVPETFRHIKTQLPLLIDTLKQTQAQADATHLSEETAKALKPVIEGCLSQVKLLEEILIKALPTKKDSSLRKGLKALTSLAHDKDVQRITTALDGYVQTLTYYASNATYASNQVLQKAFQELKLNSDTTRRKPCFMVKFDQDPDFIGREDILKEIDQRHGAGRPSVAIAGIGGVGKSRIAIECCYRYKARQPEAHVFWVHASNHARFEEAYRDIARELAIPGYDVPDANIFQLVLGCLSDDGNGPWLLVLDNADDMEIFFGAGPQASSHQNSQKPTAALVSYLPKSSNGSMIITTRDRRVGERLANRERAVDVLPLATVDAESLLRSKVPEYDEWDEAESYELLEALNHLPLAITQAAAFISENSSSVADYLEMLRSSDSDFKDLLGEDLHDPGRDLEIQNSVFQTWKISFDQISRQKPRAAEILSLMALLDRQAISGELLRNDDDRNIDFVTAIGTLRAFSLISEEKRSSTFGIHRLVQLSTQKWLELQKKLEDWQERALDAVARCCPLGAGHEYWTTWEAITPHCQIVLEYSCSRESCLLQRAEILNKTGNYNIERGRYQTATERLIEALAIRTKLLGVDHYETLRSMAGLGSSYRYQGKLDKAEELQLYVLKTWKRVLGSENHAILQLAPSGSMNSLALIYQNQGRWKEAEELHVQVLDTCKKVLGLQHPDTLTSMNNLATIYISQGQWKKAEELHMQVLDARKIVLGLQHPDTLASMNNLATVYHDRGLWKKAEELLMQVLNAHKKVLGLQRPDTLTSMNNLATIYRSQGQWKKAEELHMQVLDARKIVLGLQHPDTLASMNNLATIYHDQGLWKKAEELDMRVLDARKKLLGLQHPDTLGSMSNLAHTYKSQSRNNEAIELMKQAVTLWTEILGADHPYTVQSIDFLSIWTGAIDNPEREPSASSAIAESDEPTPEAANVSRDSISAPQVQASEQPEHAPEESDELIPSSDDISEDLSPAGRSSPLERASAVSS